MIHSDNNVIDHAAHGRLGTGAKTPEGLAASARNATKHGLSAQTFCLLHNEDSKLFHKLKADLMASLTPRNALELIHVEKIVESTWLLYRVSDLETKVLITEIEVQRALRGDQFKSCTEPAQIEIREANLTFFALDALEKNNKTFQNLARYRTMHERSLHRASHQHLARNASSGTRLPPTPFHRTCEIAHRAKRSPVSGAETRIRQNEGPPDFSPAQQPPLGDQPARRAVCHLTDSAPIS